MGQTGHRKSKRQELQQAGHVPSPPASARSDFPDSSDPATVTVSRTEIHAGPLPHPQILAGYEAVIPGAADRILRMTEKYHQHLIETEDIQSRHVIEMAKSDSRRAWAGLIAGFMIALAFLGVSAWLIASGHETSGAVLGTVDIVSLVGVFVYGYRLREKAQARDEPFEPRPGLEAG